MCEWSGLECGRNVVVMDWGNWGAGGDVVWWGEVGEVCTGWDRGWRYVVSVTC